MPTLILYTLLSSAMFYLGSRALITEALWSRYPSWLERWADCSACTGFWWGIIAALVLGRHVRLDVLGLDAREWFTPIIAGLCTLMTTPMIAGLMQAGFDRLGSAVAVEPPIYSHCTKNPKCRLEDGHGVDEHGRGCYLDT